MGTPLSIIDLPAQWKYELTVIIALTFLLAVQVESLAVVL